MSSSRSDRGSSAGSRGATLALLGCAVGVAALFGLYRVRTFDTFFHLATGEFILAHREVPKVDPFSFTFRGADWQNHSWGYQILLAGLHVVGGFVAISLLQALLAACTAGLAVAAARRGRAFVPWAALLCVVPAAAYREVLEARPHMLAFVCLGACLALILAGERAHPRRLAWLLLIYPVWATVHGSHVLLFVLLGLAMLASVLDGHPRRALPFSLIFAGCLVFGLALAPAAFLQGGEHVASAFLETSVREWAPVSTEVLFTSAQGGAFLLLVLLAVVGLVPRSDDPDAFATLPGGTLPALLLGTFALLAFTSLRMLALFALGAGPLWLPYAARALSRLVHLTNSARAARISWGAAWLGLLAASAFLALDAGEFRVGAGLAAERFPEQAVQSMRQRGRIHRLYNAYNYGGYLIWRRHPEAGVFVDGRAITVYPPQFLEAFVAAYENPNMFEILAARYAIDGVLLPTQSGRARGLIKYLEQHPRFVLAHQDPTATVFELRQP